MIPQTSIYLGELRCRSTHGPSGVEFITDAPTDNQGKGESFSPTDLVVTALATCVLTTAGIIARRDGVKLEGTKVFAEKHMTTEGPRRIEKIVLRFEMASGIPNEYRPKFETVTRTCPVKLSLHPDVAVEMEITYKD
jgi:putative redox protein